MRKQYGTIRGDDSGRPNARDMMIRPRWRAVQAILRSEAIRVTIGMSNMKSDIDHLEHHNMYRTLLTSAQSTLKYQYQYALRNIIKWFQQTRPHYRAYCRLTYCRDHVGES